MSTALSFAYTPRQTVVSMSSWIMHRNNEVFPDPMRFEPTRWLDPAAFRRLEANMMAFGGGSRACVGMPYVFAPSHAVWNRGVSPG